MAIGDKTFPWARRASSGTSHYKGIYEHTFGYTETRKKVAAGSATAVLASTVIAAAGGTVSTGITNPDVPRALTVVTGGTTGDIAAGNVEVHGTNVEGKAIHEEFALTANQNGTTSGVKAFKTVTSIDYPPQDGAAGEISIGTQNLLGVNHRLPPSETTVKVFSATTVGGALTLQNAPTLSLDESSVEQNLVTPATTPDGTTFLIIAYTFDDWAASRISDNPTYWDATTTSTSTTTATTTTTSTSSTSTSSTSTSLSTSSTSISTSSTSTSTTTVA
jgi:hypothetical protein